MTRGRLITWHSNTRDFNPKDQGILATCERIHMMSTGSSDFHERDWSACREFLIERVSQWMTYEGADAFGAAVKTLIEVTLKETRP